MKFKDFFKIFFIAFLACVALTACGGDDDEPDDPNKETAQNKLAITLLQHKSKQQKWEMKLERMAIFVPSMKTIITNTSYKSAMDSYCY